MFKKKGLFSNPLPVIAPTPSQLFQRPLVKVSRSGGIPTTIITTTIENSDQQTFLVVNISVPQKLSVNAFRSRWNPDKNPFSLIAGTKITPITGQPTGYKYFFRTYMISFLQGYLWVTDPVYSMYSSY